MTKRYQQGSLETVKTAAGLCWYIRFTTEDGKRPRFRIGLKSQLPTQAKASRAAQTLRDTFNNTPAELPAPTRTFADVIQKYEAEEMPTRYSTRKGYMKIHRNYITPRWGQVPVQNISALEVRDWLLSILETGKSTRTVGHILAQMRVLFRVAMFWNWIPAAVNPMSLFSIPGSTKRTRRPRVITPEQFRAILHSRTELRERAMLIGAYCLGLRVSELFGLRWGDFDHLNQKLTISRAVVDGRVGNVKTERSEAPLPLADRVGSIFLQLRQHSEFRKDEHFVFASDFHAGEAPLNSKWIQQTMLIEAGKGIELDFSLGWHTFRHSYKVLLERAGADITVQRDLMRHADAHTTMQVYGEVEFDRMRDANDKALDLAFAVTKIQ